MLTRKQFQEADKTMDEFNKLLGKEKVASVTVEIKKKEWCIIIKYKNGYILPISIINKK